MYVRVHVPVVPVIIPVLSASAFTCIRLSSIAWDSACRCVSVY